MSEPSRTPGDEAADVQLWQRWRLGEQVDIGNFLAAFPPLGLTDLVSVLLIDQRERWLLGEHTPAEGYLRRFPVLETAPEAVVELAYGEFLLRQDHGQTPS